MTSSWRPRTVSDLCIADSTAKHAMPAPINNVQENVFLTGTVTGWMGVSDDVNCIDERIEMTREFRMRSWHPDINLFSERLRSRRPYSFNHPLAFICLAYSMMSPAYATISQQTYSIQLYYCRINRAFRATMSRATFTSFNDVVFNVETRLVEDANKTRRQTSD
jgi:hypothetical protein